MARTPQQRRSQRQEERAAEEVGGRAQAGSGSSWRAKSDVRDLGKLRLECKYTEKAFYTLHLSDLKKIQEEAVLGGMEDWAMQVEFSMWKKKYAVLGYRRFRHMHGFVAVGDEPGDDLLVTNVVAEKSSTRLKVEELIRLNGDACLKKMSWCVSILFPSSDTYFAVVDWDTYLHLRENCE